MSVRQIDGSKLFVLERGQPLEEILKLRNRYDAVAYEYKGDWYLLGKGELLQLRRELPASEAVRALGGRPKVATVAVGTKPTRPAVVVDVTGRVSAAWLRERAPKKAAAKKVAATKMVGAKKAKMRPASPRLRGRPAARQRRSVLSSPRGFEVRGGGSGGGASPPGGDPPDGPRTETIHRTPHLDAPEEIVKKPGTELTVSVYVDTKELRAGESGEGIELDLPPELDSVEVGVLLQLIGPFELVEGSEFRTLTIARDEEESDKLKFKLRVTSTAADEPGPASISALFTLRGRACGQVARHWDLAVDDDKAVRSDTDAEAPVSMPLHIDAEQPSLSIFITAPAGGTDYQCAVQAPALKGYEQPTTSKPYSLPPEAANFRRTLLKALTDEGRTPAGRFRALGKFGLDAWEAAPQMVKDVLWKMIEKKVPPTTIYVQSVEPILPWELMIPRRTLPGNKLQKLGPLGVEFAVGRWTRGESSPPSPNLRVDRSFVIAPTYKREKLNFGRELKLIESKLRGERIEPATIEDLDERFGEDHASLLHFVCHGAAGKEDDDAIALDAGELLFAGEMETLDGFEALCQNTHPLVFLNSCSTGQMVPSLAGGAGFPKSFGAIGANAIVAPLWPVDDKLAATIALEFYKEALKPGSKPLAEILQRIRRRGYETKDADTYAAYCFFGDPQARLELVDEAG